MAEMHKRLTPLLMIFLVAASPGHAQSGGGGGGGGHGRGGGGGGGRGGNPPGGSRAPPPAAPAKPFTEPEIVGIVKMIDADAGRVTIAYEPVGALNWPAGTQPFAVSKSALLKDLTVGEKVRFTLESQQIAAIRPF
jgi:Cu/Ag efflux protein CusF